MLGEERGAYFMKTESRSLLPRHGQVPCVSVSVKITTSLPANLTLFCYNQNNPEDRGEFEEKCNRNSTRLAPQCAPSREGTAAVANSCHPGQTATQSPCGGSPSALRSHLLDLMDFVMNTQNTLYHQSQILALAWAPNDFYWEFEAFYCPKNGNSEDQYRREP